YRGFVVGALIYIDNRVPQPFHYTRESFAVVCIQQVPDFDSYLHLADFLGPQAKRLTQSCPHCSSFIMWKVWRGNIYAFSEPAICVGEGKDPLLCERDISKDPIESRVFFQNSVKGAFPYWRLMVRNQEYSLGF